MINRSVVIHSDRGTGDTLFAKIAGTILSITPGCDVVDGSQGMEKDNVRQISAYLFTTVPFWPDGTLFLSCVGDGDPIAVRLKNGSVILSPNNGTATMCVDSLGMESARYPSKEAFGDDDYSLARCAAALAGGEAFADIGPEAGSGTVFYSMPRADIREGYARGEVAMLLKTFGNITFSIIGKVALPFDPSTHSMHLILIPVLYRRSLRFTNVELNVYSFKGVKLPNSPRNEYLIGESRFANFTYFSTENDRLALHLGKDIIPR